MKCNKISIKSSHPFSNDSLCVHSGSEESVKFLLKLGAPTGVYDVNGCSAVQLMIEKIPQLSYEGLNQFYVEDHAMRRRCVAIYLKHEILG